LGNQAYIFPKNWLPERTLSRLGRPDNR